MNPIAQILVQNPGPNASMGTQSMSTLRTLGEGAGKTQNPKGAPLSFMELLTGMLSGKGKAPAGQNGEIEETDADMAQMMPLLAAQLIMPATLQGENSTNQAETPVSAQETPLSAVAAGGHDMDVNGQSASLDPFAAPEDPGAAAQETQPRPFDTTQQSSPPVQADAADTAVPADVPVAKETKVVLPLQTGQQAEKSADVKAKQPQPEQPQLIAKTPSLRQAALSQQSGSDGAETGGQEQEGTAPQPKPGHTAEGPQPQFTAVQASQNQAVEPSAAAVQASEPLTEPAQLMDRLVRSVTLANSEGESSIELSLEPAFLGKLHIKLTSGADGGVTARLVSADSAVRSLLSTNVDQLRAALTESGINLQGIDISGSATQGQTADSRGGYDRRKDGRSGVLAVTGRSASYEQDYGTAAAAAGTPSTPANLYGTVEYSA